MENKIYKLYKDSTNKKTTKEFYLKPMLIGVGSAIGTSLAPFFELSDNPIKYVFGGVSILIFSNGLGKAIRYKKLKKEYEEKEKLFELFKMEAKKVLGKDVNIDLSNVSSTTKKNFDLVDTVGTIVSFKDGAALIEVSSEDYYSCEYHISADSEEKIDLTNVVNKVYSLHDKNKTK